MTSGTTGVDGDVRPQGQGRSPFRRAVAWVGMLTAGALLLAACTTAGVQRTRASRTGQVPASDAATCPTTVHGVVPTPASLAAAWLPAGFRLTSGTPSDPASGLTYSATGSDPPRIELHLSQSPGPLTAAAGGRSSATAVEVQGQPGLLEEGPPDPNFLGIYWKPTATDLLSVVGYQVPEATVADVAQHVAFRPAGVMSLPVRPGPVVARSSAVAAARHAAGFAGSSAQAKLSSWTEVSALVQSDHAVAADATYSGAAPWQPVWAVLVTRTSTAAGSSSTSSASPEAELVVVDAASGRATDVGTVAHRAWFGALTDRDRSLGGCPGGSTVRLPFGVLTRDEATYVATSSSAPPGAPGATTSVIVKLTSVPELGRADPGLSGGCVQQDCSLDELVWPTIVVVHAPAGGTLPCLPASASAPPGDQPQQVTEYVTIAVAGTTGIFCGPVPSWIDQLQDLAPPART